MTFARLPGSTRGALMGDKIAYIYRRVLFGLRVDFTIKILEGAMSSRRAIRYFYDFASLPIASFTLEEPPAASGFRPIYIWQQNSLYASRRLDRARVLIMQHDAFLIFPPLEDAATIRALPYRRSTMISSPYHGHSPCGRRIARPFPPAPGMAAPRSKMRAHTSSSYAIGRQAQADIALGRPKFSTMPPMPQNDYRHAGVVNLTLSFNYAQARIGRRFELAKDARE